MKKGHLKSQLLGKIHQMPYKEHIEIYTTSVVFLRIILNLNLITRKQANPIEGHFEKCS